MFKLTFSIRLYQYYLTICFEASNFTYFRSKEMLAYGLAFGLGHIVIGKAIPLTPYAIN